MAFLDDIDTALAKSDGLRHTIEKTVAELKAESGTIHLLEPDGVLHLHAATGIPEAVQNMFRQIPIGKGLAGLAYERAEPVTVCNIQTDTSGDVRPGAKATGMEGAIVVPILDAADRPLGSLGVANRTERTFTQEEIATLLAVGRRIALHHKDQA